MNIPLISWVAQRYLSSKSAGSYAPLLTATAIAGIAAGVMALIVVMSVMLGFRKELAHKLAGFNAHITLTRSDGAGEMGADEIKSLIPGVDLKDISPFVQGEVIAAAEAGDEAAVQGARVRGIDPARMGALEGVDLYFSRGEDGVSGLADSDASGLPDAIVGSEVSTQLMVHPDFDDAIALIAPLAEVGPAGDLIPNRKRFRVAGLFKAGIYEFDSKYVLVGLDEARSLLGQQAEEGWHIRLVDPADTPDVIAVVRAGLPPGWKASGFDEHNKKLFAALKLERVAMSAILIMVLLIASCSIAGVVLLTTAAKRKDIAVLQSIGMPGLSVRLVFIIHAAFIGVIGAGAGLILGVLIALAANRRPFRLPDSYYLDYLPVDLSFTHAIAFAIVGVAVAIAASIYPVSQAAGQDPVEVLRYE
ncbi:MAG: ABC transporter permease [bacterium]